MKRYCLLTKNFFYLVLNFFVVQNRFNLSVALLLSTFIFIFLANEWWRWWNAWLARDMPLSVRGHVSTGSFLSYHYCEHDILLKTNRFCCKLAQVVRWARTWNGQLWGSGGQRSRSQEAEVRFGSLASFSTYTDNFYLMNDVHGQFQDRVVTRSDMQNKLIQLLRKFI